MRIVTPDYYKDFVCIASDCPDSCCIGWEVVVDDEALANWRSLGKEHRYLKARITRWLTNDGEDQIFRTKKDGRCPFLDDKGLCDIQSALGEEGLCRTCHLYPRFVKDFGGLREMGLSLSCPEACRIILTNTKKVTLTEENDPSILPTLNDLDADRFMAVRTLRNRMLELVQEESLSVNERMALILRLGRKADKLLDKEEYEEMEGLLAKELDNPTETLKKCLRRAADARPTEPDTLLHLLAELSVLRKSWTGRLKNTVIDESSLAPVSFDGLKAEENILHTFIYRYLMRAAAGEAVLPIVKLAVFSVLALRILGKGLSKEDYFTLVRLYSREVEHDEVNIEMLLMRFIRDKKFSEKRMVKTLLTDKS